MLETAPLTTWARMVTLRAARPPGFLTPSDRRGRSRGDDVDHLLVLVQVELPGLLLEPADEPVRDREVPAAVEEG